MTNFIFSKIFVHLKDHKTLKIDFHLKNQELLLRKVLFLSTHHLPLQTVNYCLLIIEKMCISSTYLSIDLKKP